MFRQILFIILLTSITEYAMGQQFRFLDLPLTDICYHPGNDRLYGVFSGSNPQGNAIVIMNPNTGSIEKRIEVGSEPSHIRVSNNGRFLFVVLSGAPYLQRYDLQKNEFKTITALESKEPNGIFGLHALDLVVLPQGEASVVVSRLAKRLRPNLFDVVVLDSNRLRPQELDFSLAGNNLVLADDGKTIWGMGHEYFPTAFKRFQVVDQGLVEIGSYPDLIKNEVVHTVYQNGRIYLQNGQIFDVSGEGAPQLLTTLYFGQDYNRTRAPQAPALDANHIYFVDDFHPNFIHDNIYRGSFLKVIDKTSFKRLDSIAIPAPGWIWNGESTKKIISLGRGRIALLSQFFGQARLMLYQNKPCQPKKLDLKIGPEKDIYACYGDSIELSATSGYMAYQWSNGLQGQRIKHALPRALIDTLRYRVMDSDGCWSEPSQPKIIYFSTRPDVPQIGVRDFKFVICPGEKANIVASSNNAAYAFVWSTGHTLVPGVDLEVDSGGIYTVMARGQYGCFSAPKSIEIFNAIPEGRSKPNITANGPLTFCSNQPTVFSGPPGAFGYEWSNGATTQSISPLIRGPLALRLLYENGCKGLWSDTLQVHVNFQPQEKLKIYQQFDQLRIENAFFLSDSLQWSFNGQPLFKTNKDFYTPKENGFYSLTNFYQGCRSEPLEPYLFPQAISIKLNAFPLNEQKSTYQVFPVLSPIDNYHYKWSNGSTNVQLELSAPGTYCVTVFRNSTLDSAVACITFVAKGDFEVRALDASVPIPSIPIVLYHYLNLSSQVVDTITSNAEGKAVFKDLPNGVYYTQAIPTPGTPMAKQYLPTYARNAIIWQDANPFKMEGIRPINSAAESQFILVQRTQMLMGEGTITGFIQADDGLVPTSENGFDGSSTQNANLANVSVVLYDSSGKVIAVTFSDNNGYYIFNNVPYGIYTVVVNLLGIPPISQPVSISANQPTVSKINFRLKKGVFVVVGTKDLPTFQLKFWPNPVHDLFYIETAEKSIISIYDSMGRMIEQRNFTSGLYEVNTLLTRPAGVYWLKVQTETSKIGIEKIVKQ